MKTFIFSPILFFFFFIVSYQLNAQPRTIVPEGDVAGEWVVGGSPYEVQGNITVASGEQLIIRPGVEVVFQGPYFFEVFGSLQASGSITDTIYFKAENPAVRWLGILFDTESALDPSQSVIRFCRFENVADRPGNENFGAIKVKQHIIDRVENCTFHDCEIGITLSMYSPLYLVQNCFFNNISGPWVINLSTNQLIENFNIFQNKFYNFQHDAIIAEDNRVVLYNINIENNEFVNTPSSSSESAILIDENDQIENIVISHNLFQNLNHGFPDASTISFTENNEDFDIIFSDNTVENCGYEDVTSGGAFTGGIYVDQSNKIFFLDNEFTGNSGYKAGAAYLTANHFSSDTDTFESNLSFFYSNDSETGNGGSIFYRSLGQNGVFSLAGSQFSLNKAERYGGSVYLKIIHAFDSIDVKNSLFTGEYSEYSGGTMAVLIENDINYSGFFNNTFTDNKAAENGGCIWFYADASYLVGSFDSDNNKVTGDLDLDQTESYIYYSAFRLPGTIRFNNDIVENIIFSETYAAGNRVIHFEDRSGPANENITAVDIRNSQFLNCNRGIFYFSARHSINEILLHKNDFNDISSDSTAGIFVKANHLGEVRLEAGTYSFLYNNLSHGGAIYLYSNTDIEKVLVHPFNNDGSEFSTCVSEGSGGILFAKAGRLIGEVEIESANIEECYADGNGGNFYFESVSSGSMPQTINITGNTVIGPTWANGGSGGFLYYISPDDLESLDITGNQIAFLSANGRGGAFYISASDIGPVTFRSNYFDHITTETDDDSPSDGGLICLLSENDIESIRIIPDEELNINIFEQCESEDNGGCIYARANGLIGPVEIDSATFYRSHAGKQGGSIYLESTNMKKSNRAQSLLLTGNSVTGWLTTSGLEGGFLYYQSPSTVESLTLSRNNIQKYITGSAGGVLYINAGSIGPVVVESNLLKDILTDGKGGGLYINAGDIGPVSLLANEFNQVITHDDNEADGGVFFLNSTNDIEGIYLLSSPEGDPNTFIECRSKRSGGCLFANAGGSIGDVKIQNTHITNCYANGDGGNFYITSGDANAASQKLDISNNIVTGNNSQTLTGGAGGFVYYQSPSPIDTLEIFTNTLNNIYTTGNGGAMYVSIADINFIGFKGNSFQNLRSTNENGGVLYLQSSKDLDELQIISTQTGDTNLFDQCFAGLNGGCIYALASGLIGEVTITGSKFNNCYAGANGGSFYLQSDQLNSTLNQQKMFLSNNEISGSSQSNTGGNGGFMSFITPAYVSLLEIIENTADGLRTNGAGGYFHLSAGKVGTATIQANNFSNFTCANPGTDSDGGAVYMNSGILPLAHLLFDSNSLNNIHGFSNGGALNISGKGIQYGIFSSNTWENITAGNSGGMAYFFNSTLTGTLDISENTFEITQPFSEIPVKGGAFFISGLDSVICSGSEFKDLTSNENGGAVCMENTVYADFNESIFNNCEAGITGGAINYSGNSQIETLSVKGCNLYHNTAHQKGGGIFVSQVDHLILGEDNNGNIFSVNQNLNGENCMGGAVYASQINTFTVNDSRFFGNSSMDGGGIYLDEAGVIDFTDNIFLGNIAFSEATIGGNGGAVRLFNVISGEIKFNGFQSCTSDNHGGAIDILNINPSYADTLFFTENYFYKNTSREGGAILSNYPLNFKRNLFTENECRNLQPPGEYVGSAISLYSKGVHSAIYNCVFDYNLSDNAIDGSIYFRQEAVPTPYTYSIQNCTFLNGGYNKAIYSENDIQVVNSLFQNYAKTDFEPEYFNEKVKAFYCNLVFADNWENSNFDSVVSFVSQNCYNVSCDQPIVDNGHPDPAFFDNHFPPACDSNRNDVGVTGGPHNPNMSSFILCEPNDTLSVKVNAVQDCDTYTFTCTEGVGFWDNYFWYLPNNEILVNHSNEITLTLDLPPGQIFIRLLVEDTSMVPSQFAFGIDSLTVKKLRIESLEVTNVVPNGEVYDVNNIPFLFQIHATLLDKPAEFDHSWVLGELNGVVIDTISSETGLTVNINEISPGEDELYFTVTYIARDEYCDFEVEETLRVNIHTTCAIPSVTFITSEGQIQTGNDSITVHFSQYMLHASGSVITESNITDIYTLVNTDSGDIPIVTAYNIFDHDLTGIIFYLDPVYLNNHVGDNLVLTIRGDQVMTPDCKIKCNGNPSTGSVPITIGIEEINGDFFIYPNPASDKIYIHTGNISTFDISVFTILGKKVMALDNLTGRNLELNIQTLPDGIYFIHLVDRKKQQISSFRIVKE